MRTKEDFIKRLREDGLYKDALSKAKNDKERAEVSRLVEGMVGQFAELLGPIIARAESDPVFVEELKRALVEGEQVVNDSEPATSGSLSDQ